MCDAILLRFNAAVLLYAIIEAYIYNCIVQKPHLPRSPWGNHKLLELSGVFELTREYSCIKASQVNEEMLGIRLGLRVRSVELSGVYCNL